MRKGQMIGLVGIAVGVTAISMLFSYNEGERPKAKDEASRAKSQVERGMIAGALKPSLTYEKKDGNYVVTFTVKNQTERVQTVTFTSGKKYDYILYRNGKKVKQFSEGKFFTQIYEERQLKQGEELVFQETFADLPPGNYTLEWWLADKNWPNAKATITFTVE
jgi:Intracellular proteinase inhibitor